MSLPKVARLHELCSARSSWICRQWACGKSSERTALRLSLGRRYGQVEWCSDPGFPLFGEHIAQRVTDVAQAMQLITTVRRLAGPAFFMPGADEVVFRPECKAWLTQDLTS